MSSSTLDRMKASLFRSKPDSPSPRKVRRWSGVLPSKATKSDSPSDAAVTQPSAAVDPSERNGHPLDPRPSPAISNVPFFSDFANDTNQDQEKAIDAKSSSPMTAHKHDNADQTIYSDDSGLEERDMKRRLMDMESSFLPNEPPSASSQRRAQSLVLPDSSSAYVRSLTHSRLRDASATRSPGPPAFVKNLPPVQRPVLSPTSSASHATTPTTRRRHIQRPASAAFDEDTVDYDDSTLGSTSLAHSLSSPSAAAARRSRLRAVPPTASSQSGSQAAASHSSVLPQSDGGSSEMASSSRPTPRPLSPRSHSEAKPLPEPSTESDAEPNAASSTLLPSAAERPSSSLRRESSKRSSASSFLSNEASDPGAGVEYSVGSGGATPRSISTLRPGNELSRLPSLGSVASSMSARTERSPTRQTKKGTGAQASSNQDGNLESLQEEKSSTDSPSKTPRNTNMRSDVDPTQTAVARNVRDVQVPATVARNFKASELSYTPHHDIHTPNFGRAKNELSLKEQNSRIDKLSKENFDLKLKIHYLYQALQDRSEEGVKELISKNADLQTDVVKFRKENQTMRKRIRELEKDLRHRDDGSSAVRTNADESEDAMSSRSFRQAQLEDEVVYLRDRMQALEDDNGRLRLLNARRKMDQKQTGEGGETAQGAPRHDNRMASLQDDLTNERSRRTIAEQEAEGLRLEVTRLKESRSPFRNLLMRRSDSKGKSQSKSPSRPIVNTAQESLGTSDSTLVEHLKSENFDLRRDLGAQTSMLTSRNRERERLQQEIEDLKLVQRRGDYAHGQANSVSGDSILDRSVSRTQARPASRASAAFSHIGDADRDHFEAREGRLRDENAALKMRNQDLQSDLDMLTDGAEHLETLRSERDDALRIMEEERDWAADTIDRLEEAVEQREKDIHRLLADLQAREDESNALEAEIKNIGASFKRVADASESSQTRIQDLEQDLIAATGEMETMEQNLTDAQAAKERLEVQAESSQGEISFLREEQEADKIKISDLQAALSRAKANLHDEKERLREFEELETEARQARDEARRLRKQLTTKDEEFSANRESLDELDSGLRKALGDVEGSRSSLVTQVKHLQRELETSLRDLEQANATQEHKDRVIQEHKSLLESRSGEAQKLSNMLEKERTARKLDQTELDRVRRRSPNDSSRVSDSERARLQGKERLASHEEDYESHLQEHGKLLYNVWTRLAALCGADWISQLQEAHQTSAPTFESICADPASVSGPLSLALEAISHNLSTFRSRMRATEKEFSRDFATLSQSLDGRSQRLDILEQEVLAQQNGATTGSTMSSSAVLPADVSRLKEENKLLRREIKVLKQASFALPGLPSPQRDLDRTEMTIAALERERESLGGRGSHVSTKEKRPSSRRMQTTPSLRNSAEDGPGTLQRHHSTNDAPNPTLNGTAAEPLGVINGNSASYGKQTINGNSTMSTATISTREQTWLLRLKELERRLIAEREERVLDREGARKRLEEGRGVIEGLRKKLERERERGKAASASADKSKRDKTTEDSVADADEEDKDRARREIALDSRGRGRIRGVVGGGPEEIV